jgi:hypothetical protein
VESVQYNAGGNWDASANPFDSPPGIYIRDDLLNLYFYTNTTDNVFWLLSQARVLSCRNGAQVRGLVTYQFSGKSNGGYTQPTGSV